MIKHSVGPWTAEGPDQFGDYNILQPGLTVAVAAVVSNLRKPAEVAANARLVIAAPDLLAAAQLLEKAETAHANCGECNGEDIPELCPECFPLFDDARVSRRLAIAKATGKPLAKAVTN